MSAIRSLSRRGNWSPNRRRPFLCCHGIRPALRVSISKRSHDHDADVSAIEIGRFKKRARSVRLLLIENNLSNQLVFRFGGLEGSSFRKGDKSSCVFSSSWPGAASRCERVAAGNNIHF
ncbi:hypothetical protein PIB30_072100 [Stylosanthes scabra]|uniref:Uncharacterized protein n=1 Tax=Stylosanthes scabra TaxID=79078 RepID=A0ABU6XLU3_9FABA|nr:hypothetical protein [Stylosanthes scabra]